MPDNLPMSRIIRTWWPLAASWLLMGVETPVLSAVMARLVNPEINLAAYGGVVFPISLIVESPVIMLLAASTALSKDWDAYIRLKRFMAVTASVMTGLHMLIAFTPLYYFVVERLLDVPPVIIEPARIGLMIMTPWTWSIAFRRFNQGVLIRFGHSRSVSAGTLIRLTADGLVLVTGYMLGNIPGIVVATTAVAAGVISEALFVGYVVQPVLKFELKAAPPTAVPLTLQAFLRFYLPLAMTSLLTLLVQPIGSAALSRMPNALESLAVWPVVSGLIFMFRSLGVAYNEVVVALLDEPHAALNLRRFSFWLGSSTTLGLLLLAATPLAEFWFGRVSALQASLVELARTGVWFALAMPFLAVLQSWYQGAILHGRRTGAITEAVAIYLGLMGGLLFAGTIWGKTTGIYIGLGAMSVSMAVQTLWLWRRSRIVIKDLLEFRGEVGYV